MKHRFLLLLGTLTCASCLAPNLNLQPQSSSATGPSSNTTETPPDLNPNPTGSNLQDHVGFGGITLFFKNGKEHQIVTFATGEKGIVVASDGATPGKVVVENYDPPFQVFNGTKINGAMVNLLPGTKPDPQGILPHGQHLPGAQLNASSALNGFNEDFYPGGNQYRPELNVAEGGDIVLEAGDSLVVTTTRTFNGAGVGEYCERDPSHNQIVIKKMSVFTVLATPVEDNRYFRYSHFGEQKDALIDVEASVDRALDDPTYPGYFPVLFNLASHTVPQSVIDETDALVEIFPNVTSWRSGWDALHNGSTCDFGWYGAGKLDLMTNVALLAMFDFPRSVRKKYLTFLVQASIDEKARLKALDAAGNTYHATCSGNGGHCNGVHALAAILGWHVTQDQEGLDRYESVKNQLGRYVDGLQGQFHFNPNFAAACGLTHPAVFIHTPEDFFRTPAAETCAGVAGVYPLDPAASYPRCCTANRAPMTIAALRPFDLISRIGNPEIESYITWYQAQPLTSILQQWHKFAQNWWEPLYPLLMAM